MAVDTRNDFDAALARAAAGRVNDAGAVLMRASLWRGAGYRLSRNRASVVAAFAFVIMILFVYITPWVDSASAYDVDLAKQYQPLSWAHPFGTDEFNRDLLVRTALGGRVSVQIGFVAPFAIMIVGIMYGAISGFAGGWVDNAMMRFLDALYGLPYL